MKLFKFELKKIFQNKTIILVLLLLVANIIVCFKSTVPTEEEIVLRNGTDELMQEFLQDSKGFRIKFDVLLQKYADKLIESDPSDLFFGIDPRGRGELPSTISGSDVYSDLFLYARVLSIGSMQADFESDINNMLSSARKNLQLFEKEDINNYNYKYQQKVIEIYENILSKTKVGYENIRGWDKYFGYEAVNIFIAAAIIMIVGTIFTYEKHTGMPKILRCSKNGGKNLVLAKLGVSFIVTIVIVLLFIISSFIVVGINQGYSSVYNAAQVLESFRHIPMVINIGTAFLLFATLKVTAFIMLSIVVLLISFLFYNYITVYIVSTAFYGLNLILAKYQYKNPINSLKFLNISSVSNAVPLISRYRAVNILGYVVDINLVWFIVFFIIVIIISLCILLASIYGIGGVAFAPNGIFSLAQKRKTVKIITDDKKRSKQSIFRFEVFKLFSANKYLWVLITAVLLRVILSNIIFSIPKGESETIYKDYCNRLYGEITDEKIEYINEEVSFIEGTIAIFDLMMDNRNKKQISEEEFYTYLEDYQYSIKHHSAINRILEDSIYLEKKSNDTDVVGWFIYDTGWKIFFRTEFDFILLLLIIIAAFMSFATEYSLGFISILRLTKYGRRKTFKAKFALLFFNAVFCSFVFFVIDLVFVLIRFGTDGLIAPLLSISLFERYNGQLTIVVFLIISLLVRLYGAIFFAAAFGAMVQLLKRQIPAAAVSLALPTIPFLLRRIGISFMAFVDTTSLINTADLFLTSFRFNILSDFGFAIIFILVSTLIAIFLLYISAKNYNKGYSPME